MATAKPSAARRPVPRVGADAPRSPLVMAIDLVLFLLLLAGLWSLALLWLFPVTGPSLTWSAVRLLLWGALPLAYARAAFGPDWLRRIGATRPDGRVLVYCAVAAVLVLAKDVGRVWLVADAPPMHLPAVGVATLLVPLLEEFVFRGVVQTRLDFLSGRRPVVTVPVQAVLFTLLHAPGWLLLEQHPGHGTVVGVMTVGLIAGALRAWTRSLWPGLSLHVAGNVGAGLQAGL